MSDEQVLVCRPTHLTATEARENERALIAAQPADPLATYVVEQFLKRLQAIAPKPA